MNDELLTIQQAAALLGVSTKTLRRWEAKGHLKPQRTIGNQRRYSKSELTTMFASTNGKAKVEVLAPAAAQEATQLSTPTPEEVVKLPEMAAVGVEEQGPSKSPVVGDMEPPVRVPWSYRGILFAGAVAGIILFMAVSGLAVGDRHGIGKVVGFLSAHDHKSEDANSAQVLGANDAVSNFQLDVNVPSVFGKPVKFLDKVDIQKGLTVKGLSQLNGGIKTNNADVNAGTGKLTASNVVYSLVAGANITISGDKQNPTISAGITGGVSSLEGVTGDVTLTNGSGISLNGLQINNTGVLSFQGTTGAVTLNPGNGISISGTTITNSDTGSAQNIFKTFSISGTDIAASNNNDTINFAAGSGIDLVGDPGSKTITITNTGSSGGLSGLTPNGVLYATSATTAGTVVGTTGTVLHGTTGGAPVFGAVDLTTDVSNILPLANGGTGFNSSTAGNGQLLIGNGSGFSLATLTAGSGIGVGNGSGTITLTNSGVLSLTGTANQVNLSGSTGDITLSLPQSIATTSTPTFASMSLTSNTNELTLGTGNTGLITLGTLTTGRTYTLPDASGQICLTSGNCAGSGGGLTGAGTTNFIAKFTSSSGLSDSSIFDNGKIGIGTTSPGGLFSVSGTSPGFALSELNQTGPEDILTGSASGATRFVFDNSGNLSIAGSFSSGGVAGLTQGTASCVTTTGGIVTGFGTCQLGSEQWVVSNGAIYTGIPTLDLLLGGTSTASAKFGFLNVSGGTPTASISASSGNSATYLSGDGILSTTSDQTLTIGGATTGNIVLAPLNGSGLVQVNGNIAVSGTTGYTSSGNGAGLTFSGSGNHIISASSGTFELGAVTLTGAVAGGGQNITGLGSINGLSITANTGTITSGTWNGTRISSQFGGTGIDTSGSTGVPVISGGTWSVDSNALAATHGGTGQTGYAVGDLLYADTTTSLAKRAIGSSGQVLTVQGGLPTWANVGGTINFWQENAGTIEPFDITDDLLLGGTATSSAKFAFIGNSGAGTPTASISATTGSTYVTGDGTVATTNKQSLILGSASTGNVGVFGIGTGVVQANSGILSTGLVQNNELQNNSVTVTAGSGLSGGGSVALGGSVTLTNAGVTSAVAGTGISLSGGTGAVTITNAGVTSLTGTTNQVNVSASTGSITLSLPQDINSGATPTFTSLKLSSFTSAGGPLYTDGTGALAQVTAGGAHTVLHGGATPSFGAVDLAQDVTGTLGANRGGTGADLSGAAQYSIPYFSAAGILGGALAPSTDGFVLATHGAGSAPSWVNAASLGTNYWQQVNGTLAPLNTSNDLLLGSTATSSAKFAFINVASGTPTASISANTANNSLYITGDGTIATTDKEGLTLGSGSTGNLTLFGIGTGVVQSNSGVISTGLVQNSELQNNSVTVTAGSGLSGGGTVALGNSITLTNAGVTSAIAGTGISVSGATGAVTISNSGVTSITGTTNQVIASGSTGGVTLSLPQDINSGASPTFTSLTLSSFTSAGGPLYTNGSGALAQVTAGGAHTVLHGGATPSFAAVDLTQDITGVLPLANGGTNANLAASVSNGGIVYSTATGMAILAANANSGLALVSGGAGAPSWFAPTQGSLIFAGANGALTQSNSQLFFDNTKSLLGIGTATPVSKLDVEGAVTGKALSIFNYTGTDQNILVASTSGIEEFAVNNNGNLQFAGGSAFLNTLTSPSITANQTITVPDLAGANDTLCFKNLGNCAGSGGGITGAGTTNRLAKFTGSGSTIGNSSINDLGSAVAMTIDASGNIGVGTTTPAAQFQVNGKFGGNAAEIVNQLNSGDIFTASSSGTTEFTINNNGSLQFTGGSGFLNTLTSLASSAQAITVPDLAGATDTLCFKNLGNCAGSGGGITGSGVNGQLAFFNGSNSITSNAALFYDQTNKLLGLGTSSPLAQLQINGAYGGNAAEIVNQLNSGNIFTASSSGATKFTIANNGNLAATGTLTGLTGLTSSGTITFTGFNGSNAVLYGTSGTGVVASATTGVSNLCLISSIGGTPTWGACDSGNTSWLEANGTIYPGNSSEDLLIGGNATASAKFAFVNVSAGTPTASISANTGGIATYLTGDGKLATTVNQTLTLGGPTTGNITLAPLNGITGAYVAPNTNNQVDLGTSSLAFRNIYAGTVNAATDVKVGGVSVCLSDGTHCQAGATNYWQLNSGALSPFSQTADLLLGGSATTSAKFAFINNAAGTPVASISAQTGGASAGLALSPGSIQSLNLGTLTLGGATTGNIVLNPGGVAALTALSNGNLVGSGTLTGLTGLSSSGTINFSGLGASAFVVTDGSKNLTTSANAATSSELASILSDETGTGVAVFGTSPTFTTSIDSGSSPFGLFATPTTINFGAAATALNVGASGGTVTFGNGGTSTLTTSGAGAENLTLTAAGTGSLTLSSDFNSSVFVGSATTPAPLSISGGIGNNGALIVNQLNSGDLIDASASGTLKFQVNNSGALALAGGQTSDIDTIGGATLKIGATSQTGLTLGRAGAATTINGSSLTIGPTSITATPTISGLITAAGGLTVNSGQNLTLAGLNSNNNSVLYTDGSGVVNAATTTSTGFCLLSNGAGAAPSWQACTGSGTQNFFQRNNNAISPVNITDDFLLGGTATTSAKFAFLNNAGGTPTASISAQTGTAPNGLALSPGSIQSLNMGTLTIGGSTTGSVVIAPGATTALTALANGNLVGNGTLTGLTGLSSSGTINFSGLGASAFVVTDGSKNLTTSVGAATSAELSSILSDETGTGVAVFGTSPTFTTSIDSGSSPFSLFATPTTINFGAAATALNVGANGGTITLGGNSSSTTLTTGTNQNLTIAPNGSGQTVFTGDFNSGVTIGTTTTTQFPLLVNNGIGNNAALVVNQKNNGDLIDASASGTLAFQVTNAGALNITGGQTSDIDTLGASTLKIGATNQTGLTLGRAGAATTINGSSLTIGPTSITATPTISGLITAAGGLKVSSGQSLTLDDAAFKTNNNSVLYTDGSGVVTAATTTNTGYCLLSNGAGAAPSWQPCTGSGTQNFFQRNNNAISPVNITDDFLLGGTATTSAKFAFIGNAGSATPVASISATTTGLALSGGGSIQALNMNNLTLGGSTTGNITLGSNVAAGTKNISNVGTLDFGTGNLSLNGNTITSGSTLTLSGASTLTASSLATFTSAATLGISATTLNIGNGSNAALATTSNGNLTLTAAGTGQTLISSDFDSGVEIGSSLGSPKAPLFINGGIGNNGALIVNQLNSTGDIIDASASGTTKFQVTNGGSLNLVGGQTSDIDTLTATTLKIGATNANAITLGNASAVTTAAGGLTVASGKNLTLSGLTANNQVLFANTSGVVSTTSTNTATQCLLSGASSPTWGSCDLGTTSWVQANGTIYPGNSTEDLLLGGTATTSAKFAFINNAAGSPTASISGNLSLAVPTGANPAATFNIFNGGSLNFETSPGGNAGLASALYIANSGKVGVGTTSPDSFNGRLVIQSSSTGYGWTQTNGSVGLSSWIGTARGLTGGFIGTDGNDPLVLFTGNTSNMAFLPGGNVNIGQDNAGNLSANSASLQVRGTGASTALFKVTDTTGADFDVLTVGDEGATTLRTRTNSSTAFQLQNAGGSSLFTLGTTGTSPVATISANTSFAASVIDQSGSGDLFTASVSGATKFVINNNGNVAIGTTGQSAKLYVSGNSANDIADFYNSATNRLDTISEWGDLTLDASAALFTNTIQSTTNGGTLIIGGTTTGDIQFKPSNSSSNLYLTGNKAGIGTTNPLATLDVRGNSGTTPAASVSAASSFASLLVDNSGSGDIFTASKSGATKFTILNNGNLSLNNYSNCGSLTTVGTILTCGGIPAGTNYWNQINGALTPLSETQDLLLGSTATGSADFAFTGVDSTNPTASISAFTNGGNKNGLSLSSSTSTIQSLNMNTLTLGGNTTGDIQFKPGNASNPSLYLASNGNVGIGTTTPLGTFDVRGNSGTAPVASISGNTTFANTIVDQSGSGDIFTASKSGATKFTILNNGNVQINNLANNSAVYTDGSHNLTTTAPTSGVIGYLQRNSGALAPANITDDLLLGGAATASAKFAFLNNAGAGTPTASISAGLTGATSLTATGVLGTTNSHTLQIGSSTTGQVGVGLAPAASFGNTRIGSGGSSDAGLLTAQQFTTPTGVGGTVTSMSVYIHNGVTGGSHGQLAIYANTTSGCGLSASDCPGSLIASTASTTPLTNNAWNTMAISATLSPNTTYWFAYWTDDASFSDEALVTPSSAGNFFVFGSASYTGTMPGTFPTITFHNNGFDASIYATFSGNSGPALTIDPNTGVMTAGYNEGLVFSGPSGYISNTQGFTGSEVFGASAQTLGQNATVLGNTASVNGDNGTAIGGSASANGSSVALGYGASAGGTTSIAIGSIANAANTASIALGYAATTTAANQLVIGGPTTNSTYISSAYFGSGVTDATPQGFTLNATGGNGSNIAGANLTLAGGKGTGNAAGGSILFQTSTVGSTGSTLQSLATRMSIDNNGNVGIGTTNALATLDVRGNTGSSPVASISGNTAPAAAIVDQSGTGDIFTASKSGASKFVVKNSGQVLISGGLASDIDTLTNTTLKIGASTATTLTLGRSGQTINLPGYGSANNSVLFADSTANGVLTKVAATSTANQCLLSGASTPTWGSCDLGTTSWVQANGTIYPGNTTEDLLLGGTATASADFAFSGVDSTNPTASISAFTNGGNKNGLSLSSSTSTIQSLLNNTLTLGGTTTGDISFRPGGQAAGSSLYLASNGQVGIGTTAPNTSLDVAGSIGASGVLNVRTQMSSESCSSCINFGAIEAVSTGGFAGDRPLKLQITGGSNATVGIGIVGTGSSVDPLATLDVRGVNATLPIASLSGNTTFANTIIDQSGSGDLFTASKSGATKFVVTNSGRVNIGGGLTSDFDTQTGTTLAIGGTTQTGLTLGRSGAGTTINGSALTLSLTGVTSNQSSVLYLDSSGNVKSATTTTASQLCLLSSGASTGAPAWGACPGGGANYWQLNSGAISPFSSNADVLFGGTATTSAAFSFTGLSLASHQTVASISGNFFVMPNNGFGGNVGLGTTSPSSILGISGQAAQTIKLERNTTANTAGNSLTLLAGGATSGATDKNGGTLFLSGGTSTGGGTSQIQFQTSSGIGGLSTVTLNSGGSGYTNGTQTLTVTGGGGSSGTVSVTVSGGSVTSINSITAAGSGYSITTAAATTGGGGTGATINITAVTGTADSAPSTKMTILGNGNVGIGTTTPGVALDINASNISGSGIRMTGSATDNDLQLINTSSGGLDWVFDTAGSGGLLHAGSLSIQSFSQNPLLELDSVSTVGGTGGGQIGINVPAAIAGGQISATLDVRGNLATTPVASLSGSTNFASLVVNNSGTGDIFTASASGAPRFTVKNSGVVVIGNNTNGIQFDPTFTSTCSGGGLVALYCGTARPTKQIVLTAEYPGAVLTASPSAGANINGFMTSDASMSATPTSFNHETYYMWNSTQTSALQQYTVAVTLTLPKDFSAWPSSGNAMTVDYNTALTTSADNALDVFMYQKGDTSGVPVYFSTNNVSGTAKNWTTVNITGTQLTGAKSWNSAGAQVTLYLTVKAWNTANYVQIGDIKLNYLSGF